MKRKAIHPFVFLLVMPLLWSCGINPEINAIIVTGWEQGEFGKAVVITYSKNDSFQNPERVIINWRCRPEKDLRVYSWRSGFSVDKDIRMIINDTVFFDITGIEWHEDDARQIIINNITVNGENLGPVNNPNIIIPLSKGTIRK